MNTYAIIILAALLLDYFLQLLADYLNLDRLGVELPAEFQDVYEAEAYAKSQAYTRANTQLGFITSTFSLVLILGFWFSGGFNALDQLVRSWQWHPIWTGLCYIGLLSFARALISLPFSIYDTFVLEERFGFNKTTVRTFILDLIKMLALSLLIGAPLLAGVLAFFQYAGQWAWLYCWLAVTIFSLFLQYIAPTWIMPLFNKFQPLQDGDLRQGILDLADKVRFPIKDIFIMDGSKRSSKSNAFFTGFGKNKRIALYDTLIEKHQTPELIAILAHEIGHYKKKHILRGMLTGIIHTGVIFFLLSIFLQNEGLFQAFYMQEQSIYAGLLFFGMLYSPIELILSPLFNYISRKHEYQADRFAADHIENSHDLIRALKNLSVHNLSNLTPHPFYVFLNYSHPPILERINQLKT
ncbi:M48 family metallopeptidase [candidate division KSB1 bacterium]|nr:M48 family metallopeptidase [candidate division KSB1 bacterium]